MGVAPQMLAVARLIGWMIVHSLWQGILLGLAYGCCRALVRRGEPRYRLGLAAMGGLVLMQAITLWMLWPPSGAPGGGDPVAYLAAMPVTEGVAAITAPSWIDGIDAALPWITLAWSAGVMLLASRAGVQWLDLRRLVRSAQAAPSWQERLDRIALPFGLSGRVRVLCSGAVCSPVLIGVIRPVILLPVAVMCRMPLAQVELILAHELAHVRRLDPLVNLLQLAIETLYFHHPVVRWISREVRNEREICCDSMALTRHPGRRREYIEALATLGELVMKKPMLLASNGGLLLERVQLIASPLQADAGRGSPARLLALGLGLVLAVGVVSHQQGLTPLAAAWSPGSPQMVTILSDRLLHRGAWSLADLVPYRASAAYPDVIPANGALPAIPAALHGNLRRLQDVRPGPVAFVPPDIASHISPSVIGPLALARGVTGAAAPVPVQVRQPLYPRQALEAGIEGEVVIEFGLRHNGTVRDMRVVHSEPEGVFDQAAMAALRDWRYAGPMVAGAHYRQTIGFTLHGPAAGQGGPRQARAGVPCTVVTGTHICRFPEGGRPLTGIGP